MTEAVDPESGRIDLEQAVAVRPDLLARGNAMADAYARFVGELGALGIGADGMTEPGYE